MVLEWQASSHGHILSALHAHRHNAPASMYIHVSSPAFAIRHPVIASPPPMQQYHQQHGKRRHLCLIVTEAGNLTRSRQWTVLLARRMPKRTIRRHFIGRALLVRHVSPVGSGPVLVLTSASSLKLHAQVNNQYK